MKEILFKAKHITIDKWYEGYYVKIERLHYIAVTDEGFENGYRLVEINPETLCQYTGLTDKNGKKIWENDVVRKTDTNPLGWGRVRTCTVSFDKLGYWLLTTEYGDGYWLGEFESEQLEVIGNIFDNPELLEGGATNE